MRYTLGQAAKATGTSKMTIQRALKAGRISGEKDETGAYSLDSAEVHRVFPLVTGRDRLSDVSVGQNETPSPAIELQLAHAKLEAENLSLKVMLDDMRVERDRWHAQAERLALAPPAVTPPPPRRQPWAWIAALVALTGVMSVNLLQARSWWPFQKEHQEEIEPVDQDVLSRDPHQPSAG